MRQNLHYEPPAVEYRIAHISIDNDESIIGCSSGDEAVLGCENYVERVGEWKAKCEEGVIHRSESEQ